MDKEKLITGFFEGTLSPDQLDVMKELLKTDVDFAADFAFEKDLQLALKKNERKEIKDGFSSLTLSRKRTLKNQDNHEFNSKEKHQSKIIPLRRLLIAASITAIIGLLSFLLFINDDSDAPSELFATHFKVYENVVHPIERGDSSSPQENPVTKAFAAYENQTYEEALRLFQELNPQKNDDIHLYKGVILMQLDRSKEAIPVLETYSNANGQLKDRAIWYTALAHLKLDEIEKTKEDLKKLIALKGYKKESAQIILDALD